MSTTASIAAGFQTAPTLIQITLALLAGTLSAMAATATTPGGDLSKKPLLTT